MNPVAQTFQSAVSRVFNPQAPSITDGPGNLNSLEQTNARPTESRRYSRLKTCATEPPVPGERCRQKGCASRSSATVLWEFNLQLGGARRLVAKIQVGTAHASHTGAARLT